jgi:hypothetical protein
MITRWIREGKTGAVGRLLSQQTRSGRLAARHPGEISDLPQQRHRFAAPNRAHVITRSPRDCQVERLDAYESSAHQGTALRPRERRSRLKFSLRTRTRNRPQPSGAGTAGNSDVGRTGCSAESSSGKHLGVTQSLIVTCRLHQIDPKNYQVNVPLRAGSRDRADSCCITGWGANSRNNSAGRRPDCAGSPSCWRNPAGKGLLSSAS